MKWGVFFCKEKRKMGVLFGKKVENGFFVKKVDLSSTQGALYTVFFILHFTYLGVRTHPPPPAYGLGTLAALSADIVGSRCFGRPT